MSKSKTGGEAIQAAALGHNKGNLSKEIANIIKIDLEIQKKKADRMNCFNRLDELGYDRKEVAKIVKIKTKPTALEFKRGVNQMCLEMDLPEEYNLTPEQLAKLEDRSDEAEQDQEEDAA